MAISKNLPKHLQHFYYQWKIILEQELKYGIEDNDIQAIENSKRRLKELEISFSTN